LYKAYKRKYLKALHTLHHPKMTKGYFKISYKYYTLLNKYYHLKDRKTNITRKIKILQRMLDKPNGKQQIAKLLRTIPAKYTRLGKMYMLLKKKYANLLRTFHSIKSKHSRESFMQSVK
jgi:hypothetical protein